MWCEQASVWVAFGLLPGMECCVRTVRFHWPALLVNTHRACRPAAQWNLQATLSFTEARVWVTSANSLQRFLSIRSVSALLPISATLLCCPAPAKEPHPACVRLSTPLLQTHSSSVTPRHHLYAYFVPSLQSTSKRISSLPWFFKSPRFRP
jgi:hypothetical protein